MELEAASPVKLADWLAVDADGEILRLPASNERLGFALPRRPAEDARLSDSPRPCCWSRAYGQPHGRGAWAYNSFAVSTELCVFFTEFSAPCCSAERVQLGAANWQHPVHCT